MLAVYVAAAYCAELVRLEIPVELQATVACFKFHWHTTLPGDGGVRSLRTRLGRCWPDGRRRCTSPEHGGFAPGNRYALGPTRLKQPRLAVPPCCTAAGSH